MKLELEGKIKSKLFKEIFFDGLKSFHKNKLLVEFNDENLILDFPDNKCHLLEFCNSNQLIKFYVRLNVRQWIKNNKTFYINDLICYHLQVIKTIKNYEEPILYRNSSYILSRNLDEILEIYLEELETDEIIYFCHEYEFPNKELNKKFVFVRDEFKDLLIILLEAGVLSKGFFLCTKEGLKGYVCEVLILHLFNFEQYLPISWQSVSHIKNKYTGSYTASKHHKPTIDETNYSHFNDDLDYDLDYDQQSDEFWNQF